MSEESWGSDHNEPARERAGVPRWVWFCGGGCLLMVLLAVLAVVVLGRMVGRMTDPDVQWERLGQVLPYDERPAERIVGMKFPFQPLHFWVIQDPQSGLQAVLMHAGGSMAGEVRSDLLEGGGEYAAGERVGVETGAVEVQGRSLPVVRWTGAEPREGDAAPDAGTEPADEPGLFDAMRGMIEAQGEAANVVVDLSSPDEPGALMLILTRMARPGAGGEPHLAPIRDEEIREFLAPFHVGEDR